MPVQGDLATMPFPELLQWLGSNGRSGPLEIERARIVKRLVFRDGKVVSTSSSDPREMLGHFLVSRGQITEDLLRIALGQQQASPMPLGSTLVEMGVLSRDELVRNLSAQAEETIFSLFEWPAAVFRFEARDEPLDSPFPIDIRVEDILLRGMQRFDEVQRIREVFDSPGIVPERTDKLPPPEVFRNKMARRIYEAIDAERTVADILLHAHGSEYLVTKFLFELYRAGLVRVRERPEVVPSEVAPESSATSATPEVSPRVAPPVETPAPDRLERPEAGEPNAGASPPAATPDPAAPKPGDRSGLELVDAGSTPGGRTPLESALERARAFMANGDLEAALDILDGLYREHPGSDPLRRLTREAEIAFVDKAWRHYVPADRVAVVSRPMAELETESFTPQEFFLLSRLDASWPVKDVVQIAPIREVDALRTLKRMRERGVIEFKDAGEG